MSEKNLWRKIYGPTEEDDGHCDSLAYSSANIIKAIESRIIIFMGHVACTRCKNPCKIMVEKSEEKSGDGRPVL